MSHGLIFSHILLDTFIFQWWIKMGPHTPLYHWLGLTLHIALFSISLLWYQKTKFLTAQKELPLTLVKLKFLHCHCQHLILGLCCQLWAPEPTKLRPFRHFFTLIWCLLFFSWPPPYLGSLPHSSLWDLWNALHFCTATVICY